jgi:hypothetical protein
MKKELIETPIDKLISLTIKQNEEIEALKKEIKQLAFYIYGIDQALKDNDLDEAIDYLIQAKEILKQMRK